jgi:glucose/arabinose dehydrogenase
MEAMSFRPALFIVGCMALTAACGSTSARAPVTTSTPGTARPDVTTSPEPTPTSLPSSPPTPSSPAPETAPLTAPATDPASVPSGPPALRRIADLAEPIDLQVRTGDLRLFVAQRSGIIRTMRNDRLEPDTWLDVSSLLTAGGERGLLAFTFSPDGRQLYIHYSDLNGNTQIDQWQLDSAGVPDPASRRAVLSVNQPHSNHNGGRIAFGPDAMLYIGLGDGGSQGDPDNRAQNLNDLLGKILRIDPSGAAPYAIPADNPFVGQAAKGEVWAYGLRNPWRFSWDRQTKELWIGDVGQNQWEEVNASVNGRGVNYGWRAFEGTHQFNNDTDASGAEPPRFEFSHEGDGACSVTGGVVYRGTQVPSLVGQYIFGDYCWSTLRAYANGSIVDLGLPVGNVVSIDQDATGEIYVLGFDGSVSKLVTGS